MTIKKLFEDREKAYEEHTNKIIRDIKNVIGGVMKTLDKDTASFVEWRLVDIFENEVLLLVGMASFPIGYNITTGDGKRVTITEENKDPMKRLVRITIPLDLAEKGSSDDIYNFLSVRSTNTYDSQGSTGENISNDFSTEGLSEEQIAQIRYHEENTKGRVN